MRAIDLEARVITAVDQIRAGQLVEHDFVECKRNWPQDNKARQLAGSLNRAGGDPVVYIIGIDEKSGEVFDVSGTDVLDWWEQIKPKFDQTPPEMVRHIPVPVGGNGAHVVAVAFASDRAPYVVKTGSANPSLEVPMREGTGTRSARRDELLRLLIPVVRLPQVVVLEAIIYSEYYPPTSNAGSTEELSCSGQIRIYIEHNGQDLVTLPAHGMRGRVTILDEKYDLEISPPMETASVPTGPASYSFQRPGDGVTITGPRAVPLQLRVKGITLAHKLVLVATETMEIEIELEVLHAVKPLKITAILPRNRESNMHKVADIDDVFGGTLTAGSWRFKHPGLSSSD
ncbi:hypothetical protein [Arthrobacter humicola]|uniref:hypothetical protein n=1 Tax=Arthrobacter humicola TaxID=409291 RepID=UPI001FAD2064|nr:hypothetical protein [Arthrobacter humicola]MCI9870574.1 hypothetical protein [Arthrobacter humicola]